MAKKKIVDEVKNDDTTTIPAPEPVTDVEDAIVSDDEGSDIRKPLIKANHDYQAKPRKYKRPESFLTDERLTNLAKGREARLENCKKKQEAKDKKQADEKTKKKARRVRANEILQRLEEEEKRQLEEKMMNPNYDLKQEINEGLAPNASHKPTRDVVTSAPKPPTPKKPVVRKQKAPPRVEYEAPPHPRFIFL